MRLFRTAVAIGLVGVGLSLYLSRRDSGKKNMSRRSFKMAKKLGKSAMMVGSVGKKAILTGASSLQGLRWH